MKKIGKLFSLATAIATLIALPSCGQKNSESKTANAEPQAEYSLNAADISLENEFSDILCLDSYSNTIFVFGMLADGSYGGYTSNDNLTSFEGFYFKPSDDEAVITSTMLNDTDKAIVTYKDEKTLIHIFDDKGKEKAVNEYSNLFDAEENHVTVLPDQNGFYVNVNNEKVSYADYSGNVSPIKQIGDKDILGITKNKDNKAVILLSGFDGKTTIADLNEDNISNERSCGDKSSAFLSACTKEQICKLSQVVGELSERDRKLIEMLFYENKTERECAAILNTTQQNIHKIKKRILCNLNKLLKK